MLARAAAMERLLRRAMARQLSRESGSPASAARHWQQKMNEMQSFFIFRRIIISIFVAKIVQASAMKFTLIAERRLSSAKIVQASAIKFTLIAERRLSSAKLRHSFETLPFL